MGNADIFLKTTVRADLYKDIGFLLKEYILEVNGKCHWQFAGWNILYLSFEHTGSTTEQVTVVAGNHFGKVSQQEN